ncbi:MAG: hypothetical protein IPN85_14475 [Flavobacteriales bacterium]|nr:hypothetical protein [Flavobacteriales bacterium]
MSTATLSKPSGISEATVLNRGNSTPLGINAHSEQACNASGDTEKHAKHAFHQRSLIESNRELQEIAAFLLNELSSSARVAFEAKLESTPGIGDEMDLMKELLEGMENPTSAELVKRTIEELDN